MSSLEYKVFQMTDGSVYKGFVQWGTLTPSGQGEMSGNVFSYIGSFKNGEFDGQGTITYHTVPQMGHNAVYQYEGGFRMGKYYGAGRARYHVPPNAVYPQARASSYYEGGWREGLKTGYGTMIFANGQKYVGGWNKDMEDGYGTWTMNQSQCPRYEGGWKNGVWEGNGRYYGADGTCEYEGGYKCGKKDGNGAFLASDGRLYTGYWQADVRVK